MLACHADGPGSIPGRGKMLFPFFHLKQFKKINAFYSLEGTVLKNVDNIKYLGVTISKDLKWNTHVSNVCTKANRTLGFFRRNLSSCPQDVKEMAYKGLVRSILEYASPCLRPTWNSCPGRIRKGSESCS